MKQGQVGDSVVPRGGRHYHIERRMMGYFSDAYRDFKWFEKMRKEANVGKRDFKQIDKIHRKNKMKKRK